MNKFSHVLSDDGLTLVSTATVNDKNVELEIQWPTQEVAQRNYWAAVENAEKYFKTLPTSLHTDQSRSVVTTVFKTRTFEVKAGRISGQIFDEATASFGQHILTTKVVDGKIDFKGLHHEKREKPGRFVVGIGGKSAAVFLSFNKRKAI